MVVPPTGNKSQYHERLSPVWKMAAEELSEAEHIFISGYSLPKTDQFFRYLYALGTMGDTRIKKIRVYDPDKNVEDRFRELLGPSVLNRLKCQQISFKDAIKNIQSELDSI